MQHSKQLIALIDSIIGCSATYIPGEGYFFSYDQLDEHDIERVTAQIMAEDEYFACEATGSDNPAYSNHMLPALTRHLQNPCDKDEQIEFMKEWRQGIASYARRRVESLLEDRLSVHNFYMTQEGAA